MVARELFTRLAEIGDSSRHDWTFRNAEIFILCLKAVATVYKDFSFTLVTSLISA